MNVVPRKRGHSILPFPGESVKHQHVLVLASYFESNHIYHQKQIFFFFFFNAVNKLSQLEQHCLIKLQPPPPKRADSLQLWSEEEGIHQTQLIKIGNDINDRFD